ncbi:MAG: hypothetical protein O2887_08335 [Bacteroidetes bacterium]|nr:hypothetical protein [Bacteroidota bacterium]MDA1120485.1 hypothetical protein [Bacteroidota bacterium]
MKASKLILFSPFIILLACNSGESTEQNELKTALIFFSSFDGIGTADYAKGDENMYTASSRQDLDQSTIGMNSPDHAFEKGQGLFGDAFKFTKKSKQVIFYKSKDNVAYDSKNWSGTVSFWMNLDPSTDLEPGYTDPLQITDEDYNDAAIWIDFTDKNPRDLRLGTFGDLTSWNPDNMGSDGNPEFERRLIRAENPPFKKGEWTHIAFIYSGLGSGNGQTNLYLNGKKIGGLTNIKDPFTWELDQSKIFVGLNFVGLMDEISIYNKALNEKELTTLYQLKDGVRSLL